MKIYRAIFFLFVLPVVFGCKKKSQEETTAPIIDTIYVYLDKVFPHDTVYLKAHANKASTFKWNFDDGTTEGTGDSVRHIYSGAGYYDVICSATADGKTSTKYVYVNNTQFTRAKVVSVTVTSMPSTPSSGTTWDNDGTGPDLRCIMHLPNNEAESSVSPNVIPSSNMNAILPYTTSLIVTPLSQNIPFDIVDVDDISNDMVQSFYLNNGFKDFVNSNPTDSNPHDYLLTQGGTSVKLKLQWLP
jgi:PKD repeat protein